MTDAPRTAAALKKFADAPGAPKKGQVVWLVGGFDFLEDGQYNSFGRRCRLQGMEPCYFQLLDLQSGERVLSACAITTADIRKDLQALAALKESAQVRAEAQARYLSRFRLKPEDAEHWADALVPLEEESAAEGRSQGGDSVAQVSTDAAVPAPASAQDWDISPATLLAAAKQKVGADVEVSAPYFVDKRRVRVGIALQAGAVSFGADFLYRLGRFA